MACGKSYSGLDAIVLTRKVAMDRPFLLIMWNSYYPAAGTGDWLGRYATYEEARSKVVSAGECAARGFNVYRFADNPPGFGTYEDWMIVNLRTWEPGR